MRRLLRSLADIRAGEGTPVLVMGAYYFVLLVTYYLLKPTRDSLFLVQIGPEELPLVFILIAVVVAPLVRLHSLAARRTTLARLLVGVTCVMAACLVGLWALMPRAGQVGPAWLFYGLYVFVSFYGALVVSQFWLLANAIFTASQGRRLFAVLNTGAILGAFTGGEIAHGLVTLLPLRTADLLLVTAGVLVATLGLVRAAIRLTRRDAPDDARDDAEVTRGGFVPGDAAAASGPPPPRLDATDRAMGEDDEAAPHSAEAEVEERDEAADLDDDAVQGRLDLGPASGPVATVRALAQSPLLVALVALIALEMMTATFVDFQFKTITARAFPTEDALTGFLATFYGRVSLFALAFQVVVLPRMLSRFGVASALLIMPVGIFVGTVALFVLPGLWAAVLLRGADQSFEHSADKVGRELLFLPIPEAVQKQVKVFIDVFVDRGFRGLAGALLLLLTMGLGLGVDALAGVMLALVGAWITAALLARRRYTDAFEVALRRGRLAMTTTWTRATTAAQALDLLADALDDADDVRILYALQALEARRDARIVEAVRPLLRYPTPVVRRQALKTLAAQPDAPDDLPEVDERMLDRDASVQRAAFRYRFRHAASGPEALADFLDAADAHVATAAAACVVRFGTGEEQACLSHAAIFRLLRHDDPDLRAALAQVLATADDPDVRLYLRTLAKDDDPDVRRAAVLSMGLARDQAFVPVLIRRLADDDLHVAVWDALAQYGPAILNDLVDAFRAEDTPEAVRRRIPRVISAIPDPRAADALEPYLQCADPVLRYNVSSALLRLRAQDPDIEVDREAVTDALNREIRVYYGLAQALSWVQREADEAVRRLRRGDGRPDALAPTNGAEDAGEDAGDDASEHDAFEDHPPPEETAEALDELLTKRMRQSARRIFQLLGLRHGASIGPNHPVRLAYDAIVRGRDDLRALAVEWLDNALDADLRRRLRPIIDPPSLRDLAEAGRRLMGLDVASLSEALALLIDAPDPKMQAHALRLVPAAPTPQLLALADDATDDADARVRDAARHALATTRGAALADDA